MIKRAGRKDLWKDAEGCREKKGDKEIPLKAIYSEVTSRAQLLFAISEFFSCRHIPNVWLMRGLEETTGNHPNCPYLNKD